MKPCLIYTLIAGFTALGTLGADEKTKPAPETDGAPKKTKAAPEATDDAPKKTKAAPEVTDGAPKKTKAGPEKIKAGPEKTKLGATPDYPFWASAKRGAVPQFVPGLNAALQLTAAQKEQLAAARDEMAADEGVKAARAISKSDPNVTAEQRENAGKAVEAANAKFREKVAAILTAEQKTLIEKINAAHAAAVEDTGIVYADKFASIKADPEARRRIQDEKNQDIEEQFLHKLDGILTPAQREAMDRDAQEEVQRAGAAPKKPVKN